MRVLAMLLISIALWPMHSLAAEAESKPDEKMEGLLRQLSSVEFEARQTAARTLEELGEPAVPGLEKYLENATDPEIQAQVQRILAKIAAAPAANAQVRGWISDLFDAKSASRTFAVRRLLIHNKAQEVVEGARTCPEKELPALVQLLQYPPILSLKSPDGQRPALAALNGIVQQAGFRLGQKKMFKEFVETASAMSAKILEQKEAAGATELAVILAQMTLAAPLEEAESAPITRQIQEALSSKEAWGRRNGVILSSSAGHLLRKEDATAVCERLAAMFSDPDVGVASAVADHFAGKLGNQFSAQYSLAEHASPESRRKIADNMLRLLKESPTNSYDDDYRLGTLIQFADQLQATERGEAVEIAHKMVARERQSIDAASKAGASVMLNRLQNLREMLKELEEKTK